MKELGYNMNIFSKLKWIAALVLVFCVILATNLIDQNHFKHLQESVHTIYADRLVAKDYLNDITLSLKEIEYYSNCQQVEQDEWKEVRIRNTKHINTLIDLYINTKFTQEENELFQIFQTEWELLQESLSENASMAPQKQVKIQFNSCFIYLEKLSKLQVTEGEKQLSESTISIQAIDLFTTIEIYALLAIAILIQVLILYSSKSKEG